MSMNLRKEAGSLTSMVPTKKVAVSFNLRLKGDIKLGKSIVQRGTNMNDTDIQRAPSQPKLANSQIPVVKSLLKRPTQKLVDAGIDRRKTLSDSTRKMERTSSKKVISRLTCPIDLSLAERMKAGNALTAVRISKKDKGLDSSVFALK